MKMFLFSKTDPEAWFCCHLWWRGPSFLKRSCSPYCTILFFHPPRLLRHPSLTHPSPLAFVCSLVQPSKLVPSLVWLYIVCTSNNFVGLAKLVVISTRYVWYQFFRSLPSLWCSIYPKSSPRTTFYTRWVDPPYLVQPNASYDVSLHLDVCATDWTILEQ